MGYPKCRGLDFWATDEWTDGNLPFFDEWSTMFGMQEWIREVTRDEIMLALKSTEIKLR